MLQTAFAVHSAEVAQARAPIARQIPAMWRCCRLHQTFWYKSSSAIGSAHATPALNRPRSTASALAENRGNVSDLAGGSSSLPQPQALNAGEATATQSGPKQASSKRLRSDSSNGSSNGSMPDSSQDVQQLRQDLSHLSETVTAQAKALQEQMLALQQARQLIDSTAASNILRAPEQSQQSGWNKDIKPFEVQRNAIGDRRYLGGYDARFHSTNM